MAWHYILNGASQGPVEQAEINRLHQQHIINDDTHVWTDGMAEWLPYRQSTLAMAPAFAGHMGATHTCAECGKLFPEEEMLNYEQQWVCASCKPLFFQRIKEGVAPLGSLPYASVGQRFAAIFIDGLILVVLVFIPVTVMMALIGASTKGGGDPSSLEWLMPFVLILQYGLPAAFEIFFIGKYGATPGKMLMKVKVVAPDGSKIGYGRSTGRYFAKMLSAIMLYIGFIMAIWDEQKRALHDRICKTRVIVTKAS